jgi:3-oxoacyl-[acyl-carrier protein] reductase
MKARVGLVTGGTRGIGAAICRELAARGTAVAFTYRSNADRARQVAADLEQCGGRVVALPFDLDQPADAVRLVEATVEHLGGLHSLVLNAGVWDGGRIEAIDPAAWWSVIHTNLGGALHVVRAALPALRAAEQASVTFVSSAVGLIGFPGDTAYASVKAAMVGFARSLAKEVAADGIRVNVLAPGFVDTDMTAAISARAREQIAGEIVLGRFGTADEIARAAAFLAEEATYCTGTVLTVDGGWTL